MWKAVGPTLVLYTPGLYADMAGFSAGDQILVYARQVFYLETTAPAKFFLTQDLYIAQAGFEPDPSALASHVLGSQVCLTIPHTAQVFSWSLSGWESWGCLLGSLFLPWLCATLHSEALRLPTEGALPPA